MISWIGRACLHTEKLGAAAEVRNTVFQVLGDLAHLNYKPRRIVLCADGNVSIWLHNIARIECDSEGAIATIGGVHFDIPTEESE